MPARQILLQSGICLALPVVNSFFVGKTKELPSTRSVLCLPLQVYLLSVLSFIRYVLSPQDFEHKFCSQAFDSFSCLSVNMLHITVDNWTRPGVSKWPAPCTAAKSPLYCLIASLFQYQGLKQPFMLLSLTTPMYPPWILHSYPVAGICIPHFFILQGIFFPCIGATLPCKWNPSVRASVFLIICYSINLCNLQTVLTTTVNLDMDLYLKLQLRRLNRDHNQCMIYGLTNGIFLKTTIKL